VSNNKHVLVAERELELGLVAVEDPRRWVVKAGVRCNDTAIDILVRQRCEDRPVRLGQGLADGDDAWAVTGDVALVESMNCQEVVISGDDDVAGAEREFDRLVRVRVADEVTETPDRVGADVVRECDRAA
jgi:hypothetical protein